MTDRKIIGGIPIECLTGEAGAIWSGWRTLGDRELVREASAKGTHIALAEKCLACRRNCSLDEAKSYFSNEVEVWINELLQKQQIYRTSHILKNVGKDPIEYVFAICIKCTDTILRDYLAEYLIAVSYLKDNHIEAWQIIKNIVQYEKKYESPGVISSEICINDIMKLPHCIKEALCTELYFHTIDPSMQKYLSNAVVWDYLLSSNRIILLKSWIDHQTHNMEEFNVIDGNLKNLFQKLIITPEMITAIEFSNANELVKELVFNHFCCYRKFSKNEEQNVRKLLTRIFMNSMTLQDFNAISISIANDNKNIINAADKLLFLAYQRHQTGQNELSLEEELSVINMIETVTSMCESQTKCQELVMQGIFDSIRYISNDILKYLENNDIVVLALVFLEYAKFLNNNIIEKTGIDCSYIKQMITNQDGVSICGYNIPQKIFENLVQNNDILKNLIETNNTKNNVTEYELLDGFENFSVKRGFKWRFKNRDMPDFTNEFLIKKYGYNQLLTYMYYLKEARPNMAIINLKQSQSKLLDTRLKSQAAFNTHIYALRNLDKSEVLCSCISFIEMLKIDSNNLRLHISMANYIKKKLGIPIGDLLETVLYNNKHNLKKIMGYFEQVFEKEEKDEILINNVNQFTNTLRVYEMAVQLAQVHNTALPDCLLKFLAEKNCWFEFLLVAHIFSYSVSQVLKNVMWFEDVNIRKHLSSFLLNSQFSKQGLNTYKSVSKDAKQSLYYKESTISSPSSISTNGSSKEVSPDMFQYLTPMSNYLEDDDFWLTLLKCHQSQDPPGALLNISRLLLNPVYIVLATYYEPSSIDSYCYSWIVISSAEDSILTEYSECLENQIWSPNQVSNLLQSMLELGYLKTLNRAFKIFMPENPFNPFFDFLNQCICYGNFDGSQKFILEFKSRCYTRKCNAIFDWDKVDEMYMENSYWFVTVVIRCIAVVLATNFDSSLLQSKFLNLLAKSNIEMDLPVHIPNYLRLQKIVKILFKTTTIFDFAVYKLTEKGYNYEEEIERCINELVASCNYTTALELSSAAELESANIILAKYQHEFEQDIVRSHESKILLWTQCTSDFKKYNVPSSKVAEFFVKYAELITCHKERYEMLRLALDTLQVIETEQEILEALEIAMWKSCLLAGLDNIEFKNQKCNFNQLKTELLSGLSDLKLICSLENDDEKKAADLLIAKLIDSNKLDTALKISTIFNHNHKDLQILMLCLSLAEGEVSPTTLTSQQKALISETSRNKQHKYNTLRNRGLRRLSSSSSLNFNISSNNLNDFENITEVKTPNQQHAECLILLDILMRNLQCGMGICSKVALCYKLAGRLKKSYQTMLMLQNPIQFLQEIIDSNSESKVEIARDVISAYSIPSSTVSDFLTRNLSLSITQGIEGGYDDAISMWGYPLDTKFHILMELCSDTSLLGLQLLETAQKHLAHAQHETNVSILKVVVELLIRSHDCFTAACNMEGIASVLRKCQHISNILQILKHWTLLVRLVTGVGRFTEMNYVFHILKENDQFEFLLGKGLDKVVGLKTALLEFLKRNCPDNKELFTLVALHFRLYHEIALMWENEAKDLINELQSEARRESSKTQNDPNDLKLTRKEITLKQLQLVVTNFTHATQYYLQDNKLNLALRCSDQASLASLQISLLNSVPFNQQSMCILNRKKSEIDKILYLMPNLSDVLIISRAYNVQIDWANILYSHCVLNGDMKYLREYIAIYKLSPSVVQDCARIYRSEKSITHKMTENMQALISEVSDIECKYILASQLGFKQIVESMLNNPVIGAYLKDTVWKQGTLKS